MAHPQDRTAVLLVSLWVEGSPPAFRARAVFMPDILEEDRESQVLGSEEEIYRLIRRWVSQFVAGARDE